jgi:putative MATE family efflux protein
MEKQQSKVKPALFREIIAAIRGSEADYTAIPLGRAILLLSIPMILELVMESTFAIVDIYFVGQLGSSAVATVGLTETYLYLLYSVAMGLATGVTAIVARRIGEKDKQAAGRAAAQAIIIAIVASLPFAVAGILYAREILQLMGADPWTLSEGYRYTQWMLGGNVVIVLLFVINAIFRGAGDAAIAMRVLWLANGINIVLDPLLIFGWGPFPALGVEGAGIATTLGRSAGVVMQLIVLMRGSKHIRLFREHWRWHLQTIVAIIRTSRWSILQMLVAMASWIVLMRILADIGSVAVAGATIAIRIMMFTMMPAWGFSNAAATLVGQNLGAREAMRAEKSVWRIGGYNMLYLFTVSLVYLTFSRELMAFFSSSREVIEIGAEWLRILAYSYTIYGWWMVSVQAFNGAGDTRTPMFINLFFFWLIQLPLSYYLAIDLQWQSSGVFWGVFFSEVSAGLFTLWLFSRGTWKQTKV